MTRTPLRPLARILPARARGENPDVIERENLRQRQIDQQNRQRVRAEGRLVVLGLFFFCAFVTIGARMGVLAMTEPAEPVASAHGSEIAAQRADILDRKGRVLATNLETHSLYVHPWQLVDPDAAITGLTGIFPDLDPVALAKIVHNPKRKFAWIKPQISPEQRQAVFDMGEPGLHFGPREMRLYPNGPIAAHILGGASFGKQGVNSAEVIGVAGVEKSFDEYLRDPSNADKPLVLSLDLTIQAAMERVLEGGYRLMNAKGAAAILMDVHTGEIVAKASLPDFDPNDRPSRDPTKPDEDSPLFNRAVQGVYELGSTFKIFTAAQAMDLGLVTPDTIIDIRGPIRAGGFRINDYHNYGHELSVDGIITKSSNVGTARLAEQIGGERQKEFLEALGLLDPTPFEIAEASGVRPLFPKRWTPLSTMTISYGHGVSTSSLHLAAAYATIANGGYAVSPTVLKRNGPQHGPRVLSEKAAYEARQMLRHVVTQGTARRFGDVPGYAVAGKTGTADKPKRTGGYHEDKVIATFASMFPVDDPRYVLVVSLDEAYENSSDEDRREAGWTAVPVAAELIVRIAPLLGLRPNVEPGQLAGISLSAN
ncbi:peptidoglycan D,D-transpeptidase FtsI family protein [Chachezhania antarctica]|uniref:peptidoglycan D,D-transpeptidase FtsI family protein n=1 Tax=Chachezhania antarctica TaxID=2340860 RepID=UPI000EAC3221|nr:penicillin-binding protein 2 [Chachezhania antarctica]|tara:strand:- start:105 stop:1892 length:1788 start_codon:yes stop_codon:yes gene_type:complete